MGAMMLAEVTTLTVADPTARRRSAAITQPSSSGDMWNPPATWAIALSTPADTRTRPKPPPAPTTSSTLAIGGSDSSAKRNTRSRSNPHERPNV